jgi:hypothetical protein
LISKLQGRKAIRLALALFASVLVIIALIVVFQPGTRSVSETDGSYSMSSNMNLVDQLKDNLLYPNNTSLDNPSMIYTNITSNLTVNLTVYYYDSMENISSVHCIYQVFVISSDPAWTKETYTSTSVLNLTSGRSSSLTFRVNVSSNLTKGKEIDSELGYSSSGAYAIEITDVATSQIGSSYSNLTIGIGNSVDTLTAPNDIPLNGLFSKTIIVPGRTIIPLGMIYAYLMAGIGASVVIYLLITMEPRKNDYVKKFRKDNSGDLIELDTGPPEGSIKVIDTDDLMKMALITESPVFIHENLIFTELNGKTYYSEIKKKKTN